MLSKTQYTVDSSLFQEACNQLPTSDMKTTINQPTSNFFYDPWVLKDEFKGTVWEKLYNTLPEPKGEARIIVLSPAQCYQIHADIDDRYHLNIAGEECYLLDLQARQMHQLNQDGHWYTMNAGQRHTAANFGRYNRIQLVVRHLLKQNKLIDPLSVTLSTTIKNPDDARFVFDNTVSPWLNEANKLGIISNFSYSGAAVTFDIEKTKLESLTCILTNEFKIL